MSWTPLPPLQAATAPGILTGLHLTRALLLPNSPSARQHLGAFDAPLPKDPGTSVLPPGR